MKIKALKLIAAMAAVLSLLPGVPQAQIAPPGTAATPAGQPIRIGFTCPFSGTSQDFGNSALGR